MRGTFGSNYACKMHLINYYLTVNIVKQKFVNWSLKFHACYFQSDAATFDHWRPYFHLFVENGGVIVEYGYLIPLSTFLSYSHFQSHIRISLRSRRSFPFSRCSPEHVTNMRKWCACKPSPSKINLDRRSNSSYGRVLRRFHSIPAMQGCQSCYH